MITGQIPHQRVRVFRNKIYTFYKKYRRDLPWRKTGSPYKILVSEIMLQQTQVSRVFKKYPEFLRAFPTIRALSRAPLQEVLRVWSGLGYNRRALYLHRTAQYVVKEYHGKFPRTFDELKQLPGVGYATAPAVCAFAFNKPTVFIETNIRSVFIHHFFKHKSRVYDREILPLIAHTLDQKNPRDWYYALMDYGVMLKKTYPNPGRMSRHYTRQTPFAGSHRQLRGMMLRLIVAKPCITYQKAARTLGRNKQDIKKVFAELRKEGLMPYTK